MKLFLNRKHDILPVAEEETRMTFAERLRELRKEKHMTLDELGQAIGVGRATKYKYEHGIITNIPIDKVNKLSAVLGVSRPYLLGWSEDRNMIMSDVSILSDNKIFVKAYSMMTDDERKQLSDLLIHAYSRVEK